jgi:diguanylate cyclase (GGDEF)-like protein
MDPKGGCMNRFTDQQTRILVIDDNEEIHQDFKKVLLAGKSTADLSGDEQALFGTPGRAATQKPSFDVDCAFQGQEGYDKVVAALANGNPYHLAFVDMRMPPGWDGVQTIQKLWEVDPRLQVVICSAYSEYSFERIVENLGATDRLLVLKKPFDSLEVSQVATALGAKWHATTKAELKLSEVENLVKLRTAEIKQMALVDRLTGLPNRELLNDRLFQLIQLSKRDAAHKFAVLFLDFDRFKVVNDSLGHAVGDLLLIAIADRLREETRGTDTVAFVGTAARLGGDEFVVVLDQLRDYHDAARVAERLLDVLGQPYTLGTHLVHSTASIGVTTSALGYTNPEDMVRDADTAMYRAKAEGRARYMLFDQKMHEDVVGRLTMENDLRQSIARNQLVLHYQPIVRLSDGTPVGFEALVRWQHPERGLVSPLQFISLAEEIGFIVPLGNWVLETACNQLASWRKRRPEFSDIGMNVNLSRKQLAAPDLLDRIKKALSESGIEPSALKLEITESAVMENYEVAIDVLNQIRALGIELHMDDFGTGYSSLSCLHRLPITGLKIDRSFVEDIQVRKDAAALIKAVVQLAHDMGIVVVAEGLELPAQVTFLQGLHCDLGQGFRFSRPLPAAAAEEYLLSSHLLAQSA